MKKFIWNVIAFALVIGIIGGLFYGALNWRY